MIDIRERLKHHLKELSMQFAFVTVIQIKNVILCNELKKNNKQMRFKLSNYKQKKGTAKSKQNKMII